MLTARMRIFAAYRPAGIAFLEACTPENIRARLDESVRLG
jgi:hypothetical protein